MLKKSFLTLALLSSVSLAAREGYRAYNRYEHHHYNPNAYYNRYDQNRYEEYEQQEEAERVYSEGIYDGILLNNPNNPDVQYTQPGITDDFESVYEQNKE